MHNFLNLCLIVGVSEQFIGNLHEGGPLNQGQFD